MIRNDIGDEDSNSGARLGGGEMRLECFDESESSILRIYSEASDDGKGMPAGGLLHILRSVLN